MNNVVIRESENATRIRYGDDIPEFDEYFRFSKAKVYGTLLNLLVNEIRNQGEGVAAEEDGQVGNARYDLAIEWITTQIHTVCATMWKGVFKNWLTEKIVNQLYVNRFFFVSV